MNKAVTIKVRVKAVLLNANYKRLIKIIIGLLLFFVIFTGRGEAKSGKVVVFILDDFSQTGSLTTGRKISHGGIVEKIIKNEAPQVEVIPYSVADKEGAIKKERYLTGLREVIDYAENHPEERVLLNISLAFSKDEPAHYKLIKQLKKQGIKIIAAAGNDNFSQPVYPAGYEEVIAAANANREGKAPSSNFGEYIAISAPGNVEFVSRAYYPQGVEIKTLRAGGTSFSAPRVVGLLANMLSKDASLSSAEAWKIIKKTSASIEDEYFKKGQLGVGIINKSRALDEIVPNYQLKKNLLSVVWGIILLFIVVDLLSRHGIAGIFLFLLFMLVVVPLGMAAGNKVVTGWELAVDWGSNLGIKLRDIGVLLGSIGLTLLFTTWNKKQVIVSYSLLLGILIFILKGSRFNLLALRAPLTGFIWFWALMMIISEQGLLLYLKRTDSNLGLVKALGSGSKKINYLAGKRLADQGRKVIPLLINELVGTSNLQQKIYLLQILGEIGGNKAREVLLNYLTREPKKVRLTAFRKLANFPNRPMKELLKFTVNNNLSLPEIRVQFTGLNDKEIEQVIEFADSENEVRQKLGRIILSTADPGQVVAKIKGKLKGSLGANKVFLLEVLGDLGKEAESAVTEVIKVIKENDDMWIRYEALTALRNIVPNLRQIKPLLKDLKEDEQELVRLEAEAIWEELKNNF